MEVKRRADVPDRQFKGKWRVGKPALLRLAMEVKRRADVPDCQFKGKWRVGKPALRCGPRSALGFRS